MNKYFMQKEGKTEVDIEKQYKGLQVQSVKGLGTYGEASNVYIERWVGSNTADVFIPTDSLGNPTICYNPSDVVITFLLSGEGNVNTVKRDFLNYIQGITFFTDKYRGLKSKLIFMGSVESILEGYSAKSSYIQFSCKFQKVNSIDTIV